MDHLLEEGAPISVGSKTARAFGETIIRRSGLATYFKSEMCVFRENVAALKPSPEVYLRTAQVMDVSPAEQLVFEDSIPGVEAGRAAGSTVIVVPVSLSLNKAREEMLHAAGAQALYREWTMVPRGLYNAILATL